MNMLADWSEAHTAGFQKEIITFKHRLKETGLFSDEALMELLKKHPSESLDVCTMGAANDPAYPNKFRTGDFRDASPVDLLNAAKAGKVWINVRQAMNIHPEYKAVLDKMYGGIAEKTGNKAYTPKGGILISSPVAQVPYHFDKTETILWHVRGAKRIYIYPLSPEFISDKSYEHSIVNALEDDLPYNPGMDKFAQVFDLEENQAITWPLNSPHRVDNTAFCVSVTTEYSTKESGMKNAAMVANATMRHKLGLDPSWSKDGEAKRYAKAMLGRVLKKTGMASSSNKPDMVTFKVDPKAPDYLVDTDPYVRNF